MSYVSLTSRLWSIGILRAAYSSACLISAAVAAVIIHDPLASMALYCTGLMILNQLVPVLFLLGMIPGPRGALRRGLLGTWLFDPWVAVAVFMLLSTIISLPQIFDRSLANAVFAAPIGAMELVSGLMLWSQLLPASPPHRPSWREGLLGWLAGMPMMVIGIIWIWSEHALYAPYLDVICQWNVTPLQDQRWAGMLMILFGLPLQLRAAWLISEILFSTGMSAGTAENHSTKFSKTDDGKIES